MNNKLLAENLVVILIVVIVLLGGIFGVAKTVPAALSSLDAVKSKQESVKTKQEQLDKLKAQHAQAEQAEQAEEPQKKESQSGKVIYEVLDQQFSPEASFGIMFENLLSNVTNSGIRIRTIEYDYQPDDDRVLESGAAGYNACELSFTAVGNYSQLQTFFKNIAKENYLSNIYEIYIEPYDRDKTILIAKFKVRLYTKTI